MRCQQKRAKPGDVLPIKGGYPYELPAWVKNGAPARLISFDHGYWTVEAEGRTFKVYLTQVESGWLYELNGRWLDENHPRVVAVRTAARATSPAPESNPSVHPPPDH